MRTRSRVYFVDTSLPNDSKPSDQHHKAYDSSSNDLPSFHGNPNNDEEDMKLELETVQHLAPNQPEDGTHADRSPDQQMLGFDVNEHFSDLASYC